MVRNAACATGKWTGNTFIMSVVGHVVKPYMDRHHQYAWRGDTQVRSHEARRNGPDDDH